MFTNSPHPTAELIRNFMADSECYQTAWGTEKKSLLFIMSKMYNSKIYETYRLICVEHKIIYTYINTLN